MPLGLRLSLVTLLFAGCASQLLVVPDSDWKIVPPAQRTELDRKHEAEVVAARAELKAATTGLAELQNAPPATPPPRPAPPPPESAPEPDDAEWLAAVRRFEQATTTGLSRIETATLAQRKADLAWRQARVAVAQARVDMLDSSRELDRAKLIDRNLLGTDTYDSAPLRGQFSRAQKQWYAADSRARTARSALDQATATLNTAKESYAQLMRGGPLQVSIEPAPGAAAEPSSPALPRLQLTGWMIKRSDIRLRRGLGRYRQEADNAPAKLRTATSSPRIRPPKFAPRAAEEKTATTQLAASPAPPAPVAPATTATPAKPVPPVTAPRPAPTTAAAKPAALPSDATKVASPATAAKSSSPAATTAAKPSSAAATASAKPPTPAKPVEAPEGTVPASNKPSARPSPAAAATAKPIEPLP